MFNKVLFLACTSALLMASASAKPIQRKNEKKLYIGSNSTEATMTFKGTVTIETEFKPSASTIRSHIEKQIEHTIGPMSVATYTAVPKGDHVISNVKIASKKDTLYTISYEYTGTIVVENGPRTNYDLVMPINPATIYEAAMVGEYNPCTDAHYQSKGDFWYFWNPANDDCELVEGRDYVVVKTKIERFKNTKLSYPEYHNLADENGMTSVHVLFGLDDPKEDRNPMTSHDINADNYRQFRNYLVKQGYIAKKWTTAEIKKIVKTRNGVLPYVETLEKGNISYRFFFGPTGIDEESFAFHWFYKDALENASIMIYGGHSGLGGHLDLAMIEYNLGETIKFNKKRYQIFFFDSCTSYKYYNQQYFERKVSTKDPNGTKKLDIFTNGLATYFHTMPNSNKALAIALDKALNYATKATYVSYQSLAKQIDSENLFGVSGDEDNESPKKPE
jgi:hypothetical protein